MKAIQTEYNGYKFRSRLEARWAVFFDEAGIKYQYEPEGFEMQDGTRYLPDFYLPDLDLWVEVKGVMSEYDEKKVTEFSVGRRVALLREIPNPAEDDICGVIWSPYGFGGEYLGGEIYESSVDENGDILIGWDAPYIFCVCPVCGKVGFEFEGRGGRVCGNGCTNDDKSYSGAASIILEAYKKARQARFEWGEHS